MPDFEIDIELSRVLRKIYESHFPRTLSPINLWHYTSAEKFLKILEAGDIWFTHVSCLNDRLEVSLAVEVTHDALDRLKAKHTSEGRAAPDVDMLCSYAKGGMLTNNIESQWYVASFSEKFDDLNQWRSYAGGEGGIALGFSTIGLETCFTSDAVHGASLWKVAYDRVSLDNFADSIADLTLSLFRKFMMLARRDGRSDIDAADAFFKSWGPLVDELSVVPKHNSFGSEEEWRLTIHQDDVTEEMKTFVPRKTTISRHVKVSPKHSQGLVKKLPLAQIVVGPSKSATATKKAVQEILQKYGYGDVTVLTSELPFQDI